jgi:glutamate/tyrosine decarboxylase-like PLP-dependent enzyme
VEPRTPGREAPFRLAGRVPEPLGAVALARADAHAGAVAPPGGCATLARGVRAELGGMMRDEEWSAALRAEAAELAPAIAEALAEAMATVDARPALPAGADHALRALEAPLPENGVGAAASLRRLRELHAAAGANTNGPKCFHFVIGGTTPAALGADLLATIHDALTYTWVTSPLGVTLELQSLAWLRELLGLPRAGSGVMVTGASMANFVALAAARQWWGEGHGIDVSERGLSGLPAMPVLTSGYVHASTRKVLALLGCGREALRIHARDDEGRIDLDGMARELASIERTGARAVVVVNAGEVNTGDFDPVAETMALARRFDCWVHVDGAFGLFARLSPRTEHLVRGVEEADSVTVDGHKWLNVPYDCGFAFARDHGLLARAFRYSADYLPAPDDPRPTLGAIGPESSRRARTFAVWAALAAYGREGQRRLVEHSLDLAQHLARRVDAEPELARLAEVRLNIVAFRYAPGGLDEERMNELNLRLGAALLEDGRFLVGTSKLGSRVIFRPAFSNWRTRSADVDEFVDVLLELGRRLRAGG